MKETTDEVCNYVTAFLEAKMEDYEEIPYDTARYLAIEYESQIATDYLDWYDNDPIHELHIDDPILALYLLKEKYDGDEYDENLREFLVECQDPDEMEFLEDNFDDDLQLFPYEAAVAYYNNADFVKALDILLNNDAIYDDPFEDWNGCEGSSSHFLINILDGIKEDHPQDFTNTIRDVISGWDDDICEICVKENAYSMALRIYAVGELDDEDLLKKILINVKQVDAETINSIYGQLSPEDKKILFSTLNSIDGLTPTDRLWWDVKV